MHGLSRDDCERFDRDDPLGAFRSRFELPGGVIYLDGNSLGALPVGTRQRLEEVVRAQWGNDLIRSWNGNDWIGMPRRIGAKIARLIGAHDDEVIAALEVGVDLLLETDLQRVREKSRRLGDLCLRLLEQECAAFGFELACPRDSALRGSQVAVRHPQGYAIIQALIAEGVIGDFRAPDILRFGCAPLYLRYVDVWDAVAALRRVMDSQAWDRPEFRHKATVT